MKLCNHMQIVAANRIFPWTLFQKKIILISNK